MDIDLQSPLRKAIQLLDDSGFRYAIIGGIALTYWGIVRATYDIDIKVMVPDIDFTVVREKITRAFPSPARSQGQSNPFIVAVNIDGVIVDFLLSLPGYEENIITRAVQRELGEWRVWVCSAEDLIIQKVVAGRGKDWDDVEGLLIEQRGKLDEDYIEDWLIQFADALESQENLKKYRMLLADINRL
jgi:predicted nucleotidyltransferase